MGIYAPPIKKTMRKLATIETVQAIRPIQGADSIEAVKVRGWEVVCRKGEFSINQPCVYIEIDSLLDVSNPAFSFLSARGVRTDVSGNVGHVLKTVKLRGTISQGLVLPLSAFPDHNFSIGDDVTELLKITKWEPPIPASIAGEAIGFRPGWIWKTGAERIQNVGEACFPFENVYATEKIDGCSVSFGLSYGDFHVCSHNIDLKRNEKNTLWSLAARFDIENILKKHGADHIVFQGEAYGEGINGNRLKIKGHRLAIYNIDVNRDPLAWKDYSQFGLPLAPELDLPLPTSLEEALEQANGMKSKIEKDRLAEGIVWRKNDGKYFDIVRQVQSADGLVIEDRIVERCIKVISNKYLEKEK